MPTARKGRTIDPARFCELLTKTMGESVWDFGNDILYAMCREHPGHESDGIVVAKIWLIGRAYSAAIERRRGEGNGDTDTFYESVVAPAVRDSEIDKWFDAIRTSDPANLSLHLEVHKRLTDLFAGISGIDKRSLASKYLHFHFPERYYIYDSRAAKSISLFIDPLGRTLPQLGLSIYDYDYAHFVIRCMELRRQIERQCGNAITPRVLDNLLLGVTAPPSNRRGRGRVQT
jgi:hypothetical protein